MKFFLKNNVVYAFEADGSQDHLITGEFIAMTAEQIDRHINPLKYMSEDEKYQLYLRTLRSLTRRQFRRVLVLNGYDLDQIRATIMAIEDTQLRQLTLVDWDDADTFERQDESLIMMAGMLGMSEQQVNTMWEQALTL
ncbi:hypothetical protein [Acinetobacter variabilis]|nr:hypothetical protein [Acinetobacter variabilis]